MIRILENFIHKRGVEDCKVLAIRDIFQYYGLILNPFMCSGLGSILFFQYHKFIWGDNNIPLSTVWGRNLKHAENLCKLLKVKTISHKIEDGHKRLELIKNYIDNGHPVYLELDGECLKGKSGCERLHQRFGPASATVIFGYEEDGINTFLYLTNGVYKNYLKIDGNTVMSAQEVPFLLFGPEKSITVYEVSSNKISFTDIIYESIRIVIENMLDNEELNIGTKGMMLFANEYLSIMNSCKEEASAKADKYFSILSRTILSGFGIASSSFFRGEYSKFLKEAASLVKDFNLKKSAVLFAKNAVKYQELRKILLNIQYAKHDLYGIASIFTDSFKEVIKYEEEALVNLKNSVI